MAKVETAQEATDLAVSFLKPYWLFVRPLRVNRRRNLWTVHLDVGVVRQRVGWVKVNADTGKVVNYLIPE